MGAGVTGLLLLALTSCYNGAYRVDVFPEMHYQQSYRSQEPPRLYPPADSVPITGRDVGLDLSQVAEIKNPVAAGPEVVERGAGLFKVNCAPCHANDARGNSLVGAHFKAANVPTPADLTSPSIQSLSDGELFLVIADGRGGMPPFRRLLTPEQRWTLVHFIRSLKGQ